MLKKNHEGTWAAREANAEVFSDGATMSWLKIRSPFIIASSLLGLGIMLFLVLPIATTVIGASASIYDAITDPRTTSAIWMSFYGAFLSTLAVAATGIPLAYILCHYQFYGKSFVDALIDLPILIPHNAAGIAILTVLGPNSLFGGFLQNFGIVFVDTIYGIVAAMAFVSAPFLIRSAQEAFAAVPIAVEHAAKSLGADDLKTFMHITLPLASKGIFTGGLLSWARAISEFGAVAILAYYPKTAAVFLNDVFVSEGLGAALPINALLICISVVIILVFKRITMGGTRLNRER
ncbi:MAG: ABC transporter permease [Candidatus Methanosuratus sp.]|nr:ABC transporter permease [Candidatus Methanosuratincola sp.]